MTTRALAGIIKLIPKNQLTILLLNWRPITLLTLTKKLCAKLVANKIKGPTGKIIDDKQTGFLEGRNITDNLLTYRLAQEFMTRTKQEVICMKADFVKDYDRVEHIFIWDTMTVLGYHPHMIKLAKGLVEKAESKVHVNGLFTEPIKLDRGVRQGCPLSSLLFVISTQPLMALINEPVDWGALEGIDIGGGKQLTHQLFADDTGFFTLDFSCWQ